MKKRLTVFTTGMVLVLASLLMISCSKENKEAAKPAETAAPAAPAAPTAPAPAATAGNKLTEQAMNDDIKAAGANLVKLENTSFEIWEKGVPANWMIRGKQSVKKATDATEGKLSVEVPATKKELNYIYQNLPLTDAFANKNVVVTAMAKSFEPGKTLVWGYTLVDKVQSDSIHGIAHPGDGQWHRVGVSIPVSKVSADSKLCLVLENSATSKPAEFDDVKVYIK